MLGSENYINTFFSKEFVYKKVLRMNDEIEEIRRQINKEAIVKLMIMELIFQIRRDY